MFCAECGTKNEVGAQFCENCGNKLEVVTPVVTNQPVQQPVTNVAPEPKKSIVQKFKELPKTTKTVGIVATVVVLLIAGGLIFLNSITSPKAVAEKYFKASIEHDVDALYSFVDVEESTFTSEKMFKEINKVDKETTNIPKITNYTIGDPMISADGMSASLTITYFLEGSSASKSMEVKLVKGQDKKFVLFDDWKINTAITRTYRGYEISVMKGSTLTIEGQKVDTKYISEEESTSTTDVYVMPAMFTNTYDATIELPIGVTLEDEITVNENTSYEYSLSLSSLSETMKITLATQVVTDLQAIYNGAKDNKLFDEVKPTFDYEGADLTDLKDAYESLASSLAGNSYTLTSIEFTSAELEDVDIDSNGYLEIQATASYDFIVSYLSGGETKTNDSDSTDTVYLTYDYVDGSFKLIDAYGLTSYYSRYF